MADKPNHTFLKLRSRWINMNLVTDVEVLDDRVVVRFAGPMARRMRDTGEVVTDYRRMIVRDEEDRRILEKWCSFNDVTV